MDGVVEVTFDHGENGLNLPVLAVVSLFRMFEALFRQSPVSTAGWLGGWATGSRRDEALDLIVFSKQLVMMFTVVTCICE